MNKKITVFTIILFLMVSISLFSQSRKVRQEFYLKAVAEKNPETKMNLLKDYLAKFGDKKDSFLRFIYLNLADTSFKLKSYDETIQYGELALGYEELGATNKLRLYFSLANSFNITKKDLDSSIKYCNLMIGVSEKLIDQAKGQGSEDDPKIKQLVDSYNNFYIAPANRILAQIYYGKGEIKQAAEKALAAYKIDKSEKSAGMAFSLGVNLFKKKQVNDAIAILEQVINKEKPQYKQANYLAQIHYRAKNKEKAIDYFELAYKAKKRGDLALKIGKLVYKKNPQKGVKYFADSFVLNQMNKEHDSFKYLEQLYFNTIAKDKTPAEKEAGFKQIINAAKARFNKPAEAPAAEETPETEGETADTTE